MKKYIYAMQKFQEQMKGQASLAGFVTEEDVADWITDSRRKENTEWLLLQKTSEDFDKLISKKSEAENENTRNW